MAKKKPVGRPPLFKTPKDLEDKLDEYIEECNEQGKPFLLIGFANFLKVHRTILDGYDDKPEFSDTIKRIKQIAEEALVVGGLTGNYNASMSIFLAKNNHNYKDKHEQELNATVSVKSLEDFYADS